jgi:maltodextrin utilization protein YvdJ
MYQKLSLEREVYQMLNDMMQKQGLTRSYALSLLRGKFESEERHQEVEYVEDLIRKEAEKQEQEFELPPTGTTATSTAAEEVVTTNQPGATISTSTKEVSKISYPPQQQKQETLSSKLISKQLDKQTIQINKKIIQALQPLQKQSQLIRQLQSQLRQLQKQVSQIQRVVRIKKNKKR